jgi:hypothetical protein
MTYKVILQFPVELNSLLHTLFYGLMVEDLCDCNLQSFDNIL